MTEHRDPASEAALDALIRQAFRGQPDEPPPPDFADRMMALRRQEPAPRRRWRWAGVVAAATAAALVTLVVRRGPGPDVDQVATARRSVDLGDRGVAVMEVGSALERRGGRWSQRAGNVFYRIDRGGSFTLVTPAGEVVVLGTCFRVEVDPMKVIPQTKIGFVAGAALATAVVVTVYEGRVRLANGSGRHDLAAGEQGTFAAGQAPRSLSDSTSAARPPGAARPPALLPAGAGEVEQLRAKIATQEKELAALRQGQEQKGGGGRRGPVVDVPHDELLARAARCEVRFEEPEISGYEVKGLDEKSDWARAAGLSDTERDAYNESLKELQASVTGQLRALFVEVTGDPQMAEKLPVSGLLDQLMQKSSRPVFVEARARLAKEKAGLQPPPPDLARTPAIERALRIMINSGDELEKKLGERVGAERAKALHRVRDGWPGGRSSMSGCPN